MERCIKMLNSQRDRLSHMALPDSAAFPDPSMHFFVSYLTSSFMLDTYMSYSDVVWKVGERQKRCYNSSGSKKVGARALADSEHSCKSGTPVMGSCDHQWQFLLCPGSLKVWSEYEIQWQLSLTFMVPFLPTISPTPNNLYQISSRLKQNRSLVF